MELVERRLVPPLGHFSLVRFRKIPFTCSYPPFRDSAIVVVVSYVIGFFVYVVLTSRLEYWILLKQVRILLVVPLAVGIWYGLSRLRGALIDVDKELIFEEKTSLGFEVLDLRT